MREAARMEGVQRCGGRTMSKERSGELGEMAIWS